MSLDKHPAVHEEECCWVEREAIGDTFPQSSSPSANIRSLGREWVEGGGGGGGGGREKRFQMYLKN